MSTGWLDGEDGAPDATATYGRHTLYRRNAVQVAVLLAEAVEDGRAVRLNWQADDDGNGWPTAMLPVVRISES